MTNETNDGCSAPGVEANPIHAAANEDAEAGAKWRANEVQTIPANNLKVVFPAITLAMFFAAMDQTVAAVALPTIIKNIGGQDGYSWVGTAYLLTSACLLPLYGKLSDIFGRKPIYVITMFLFLLGSALCGAAKTFLWLVLARGVQGAGAGGIYQLSMIIVSDIVPLEKRGIFLSVQGAMWCIASIVGPFVGGILTDHITWRWCFYINLPTGAFSAIILLTSLRLNPTPKTPIRQIFREFDFTGLFLLMSGVACLLVGFNGGQSSWSSPTTIALITIGTTLLILSVINELLLPSSHSPIIPPRLCKTCTTSGVLVSALLQELVFFASIYYIPVYFQVLGSGATMAGVKTTAFSVVSSVVAAAYGVVVAKVGYRPIIWVSWGVMTIGYGLSTTLDDKTNPALQEIYILITAIGVGGLFQIPLIALQAAMPLSDMATSTSVYNLIRTIGGTIGISIGGAIYGTEVQKRLTSIPGYHPATGFQLTNDVRGLVDIQPPEVRDAVLFAYSRSISLIWVVCTPISFVGLLCVLPMRQYSLQRTVVQATQDEHDVPPDAEKAESLSDPPRNNGHAA